MSKKRRIMLMEFVICVYSDGTIRWDGFDEFLLWKLNQKPEEGLWPYMNAMRKFQKGKEENKF
jgi:hypothetical protein